MSKKTKPKLITVATIEAGYTKVGHKPTKVNISYGISQSLKSDGDVYEQALTAKCEGTSGVHTAKVVVELFTGSAHVACDCDDYKWTFARANHAAGCHLGKLGKYAPAKGTGKPRNPEQVVGGCKHILALIGRARAIGMLSGDALRIKVSAPVAGYKAPVVKKVKPKRMTKVAAKPAAKKAKSKVKGNEMRVIAKAIRETSPVPQRKPAKAKSKR